MSIQIKIAIWNAIHLKYGSMFQEFLSTENYLAIGKV